MPFFDYIHPSTSYPFTTTIPLLSPSSLHPWHRPSPVAAIEVVWHALSAQKAVNILRTEAISCPRTDHGALILDGWLAGLPFTIHEID